MNDITQNTKKTNPFGTADVLANELAESSTIFGVAPSALCRALGFYSWTNDQIVSVVNFIGAGCILTRKAMTGHARMGRTGNESYGPIPTLSRADRAALKSIAAAL